jgi:hypothetical protein
MSLLCNGVFFTALKPEIPPTYRNNDRLSETATPSAKKSGFSPSKIRDSPIDSSWWIVLKDSRALFHNNPLSVQAPESKARVWGLSFDWNSH